MLQQGAPHGLLKLITSQTGGEIETFYSAPIIDGVTTVSYGDLIKDAKQVNKMENSKNIRGVLAIAMLMLAAACWRYSPRLAQHCCSGGAELEAVP